MNEYTTYCNPRQTEEAMRLGAPIERTEILGDIINKKYILENNVATIVPTAEQMIGWLRSKGFRFKIEELSDTIVAYRATFGCWYKCGQSSNPKGATLAVIDAALDFLKRK